MGRLALLDVWRDEDGPRVADAQDWDGLLVVRSDEDVQDDREEKAA